MSTSLHLHLNFCSDFLPLLEEFLLLQMHYLCISFKVSLNVFNNLFQVIFSYHRSAPAPQFWTLRSHVSFLATFIALEFTFFQRLLTSCLWYLMSIATCVPNRFGYLPISCHLSSSTSWCCSNLPLGWFHHILVHVCVAVHHVYWHSGSDVVSQRIFNVLCFLQYVLHTAEFHSEYLCIVPLFATRVSRQLTVAFWTNNHLDTAPFMQPI